MAVGDLQRVANERWEIARPAGRSAVPGMRLVGFRQRSAEVLDSKVIPFPAVTLMLDLADGLAVVDGYGEPQRGGIAAGLAPGGVRLAGSGVECVQIRLSPIAARAIMGAGAAFGGSVVELGELWGQDARRMRERLQAASGWEPRFAMLERALGARWEAGLAPDQAIEWAWQRLSDTRGTVRVEQLAADIGWSRKRLWSRFQNDLGVTPKRAARLIRFHHAAKGLAGGQPAAAVAADLGYADQAHLHREAVAFTGMTPAKVAAAPWMAVERIAWS